MTVFRGYSPNFCFVCPENNLMRYRLSRIERFQCSVETQLEVGSGFRPADFQKTSFEGRGSKVFTGFMLDRLALNVGSES